VRGWALLAALASGAVAAAPPAGNAARGEAIYARCKACHALGYNSVGPRHCGLLGRPAGSVPGFAYSSAMKNSDLIWNAKTLDRFLANPMGTVPGTAMTYVGVPDAQERADLIAWLRVATKNSPECKALAGNAK
jgi:cytochrome c